MIVVDSSVLIALLKGEETSGSLRLRHEIDPDLVLIGDLVLLEVLQGCRNDAHAAAIERLLRRFRSEALVIDEMARKAAANYRRLRALGFTIRKTPDLIIGTFCIERGHSLLHQDRDFDPMVEHLGLQLA